MSHSIATADTVTARTRERPPIAVAGPWAWLRSNLLNSWWSTAVTLVLGYVTTTPWALGTAGRVADQFRDADAPRARDSAPSREDGARVVAG